MGIIACQNYVEEEGSHYMLYPIFLSFSLKNPTLDNEFLFNQLIRYNVC